MQQMTSSERCLLLPISVFALPSLSVVDTKEQRIVKVFAFTFEIYNINMISSVISRLFNNALLGTMD